MKVEVQFQTAPPLQRWATLLADSGWKFLDHDTTGIKARKQIGQSAYPVRNPVTWYLDITATDNVVCVQVSVPVFAESRTAEDRLLSKIDSLAERVDGVCETDTPLSVDLLAYLQTQNGESTN